MVHEIAALLGDRDRLEKLSQEGIESTRFQVSWKHYLDRVSRSLQSVATGARPAAAALDMVGRETWLDLKGLTDNQAALHRQIEELQVHAESLQAETARLRARTEELLSESGWLQAHTENLQAQLSESHSELDAKGVLIDTYQARRLVRLMDRPLTGVVYRGGLKLARWRGFGRVEG
jgi:chromosome segregation ATPase